MTSRNTALAACLAGLLFASPAHAGYVFANDNGGDGSLVGGPPDFTILGSDNGVDDGFANVASYTRTFDTAGTVSFDWRYDTFDSGGGAFDPAGYVIDGQFHALSSDADEGLGTFSHASVAVAAGQTFGWYVASIDSEFGRGELDIRLSAVDEPAAALLWLAGWLACARARRWRRGRSGER
jgi:hypothetical protein